ncbi:MAG: hypothetical protein ACTS3F_06335 [Phycisphaerales bacterium]
MTSEPMRRIRINITKPAQDEAERQRIDGVIEELERFIPSITRVWLEGSERKAGAVVSLETVRVVHSILMDRGISPCLMGHSLSCGRWGYEQLCGSFGEGAIEDSPFFLLLHAEACDIELSARTDPPIVLALCDYPWTVWPRDPAYRGITGDFGRCVVPGWIKTILESQGFRGIDFIPTAVLTPEQADRNPGAGEVFTPDTWGDTPEDEVFWEIRSTALLPHISPFRAKARLPVHPSLGAIGSIVDREDIGPISPLTGMLLDPLPRYTTEAISAFEGVDVAHSIEYGPTLHQPGAMRNLFVSHRFREFCQREGIDATFYPVRIDDPEVVRGWAEEVPPWIASSPIWRDDYTGETKPGVSRNW